jgi:glycerophosphoryl diester phosphodiesterase
MLTSFNADVLATVRAVAPHIRTLSSFDGKSADRMGLEAGLTRLLDVSDIIAVEKSLLGAQWDAIIRLVPLERLGVGVPNEEPDLVRWLAAPIRQLTTDRPDRAVALRGA